METRSIDQPGGGGPVRLQRCKGETACGALGLADLDEWDRLGKLIKSVSIKSGEALKRGTGFGGQGLRGEPITNRG